MYALTHSRKFWRFTTDAFTPMAKHYRIYDCFDRGYVIMTDGKIIGTANTITQAQEFIKNYKGV